MKDSYVVQVYRRDSADPDRLTGTVERIGNGQERAFSSMSELWAFLTTERAARRRGPAAVRSDIPIDKTSRTNRRKP